MTPDLSPDAWAQIRHAYELTDTPVEDICAAHGISSGTLRDRMRRWGWTRRRAPIPAEGPPAGEAAFAHGLPPPIHEDEAGADDTAAPSAALGNIAAPPVDPAAIVPRLQQAVTRLLPAIAANLARLGGGPAHARDLERTARALGTLTRALRGLNTLAGAQQARGQDGVGGHGAMPEDIDDFRRDLVRQMNAIIAARDAKREDGGAAPKPAEPQEP
jgi:hypothetical protein